MRRALVLGVCLVGGCAAWSGRAARPGGAEGAPACEPGHLVFSAPYLPSGVVFTRAGADLVVVDRGALTLRDPATLAVRRTLLPHIDHWSRAYLSADGALLRAETIDGLRFSFDTTTWRATRLADARAARPHHDLEEDSILWYLLRYQGSSALGKLAVGTWIGLQGPLGLPALPQNVEPTAVAVGILRPRGGQAVLAEADPFAPGDDSTIYRAVLADAKGTLHLYDDRRELRTSRALADARVVSLAISGGRVLAALATGEVAILRADLTVERRVLVRAPAPVAVASAVITGQRASKDRHGLMALALDAAHGRLAWVSTDNVVGVLALEDRRALAELAATGAGLETAIFVDERHVALLTADGVTSWDTIAGTPVHTRVGTYRTLVRAPDGLLGVRSDGGGELLDAETLEVRRRICFLASGCEERPPTRPDWYPEADWKKLATPAAQRLELEINETIEDRAFEAAAKEVHAAISPDGRTLAVLRPPIEVRSPGIVGELSLWDLRTLAKTRAVPLTSCFDWKIQYASPSVIDLCTRERRNATTLAVLPGWPETPDPMRRLEPDRTPLGSARVEVWRTEQGDVIDVAEGKDTGLLELAAPESKGDPYHAGIPHHDRSQLRAQTLVVAAPGGRRFLLAGRGAPDKGTGFFPGYANASGALQVWCAPTRADDSAPLTAPEEPLVAQIDGFTERVVEGFPETVVAAAEVGREVFVLGGTADGKIQVLVALDADTKRARPVALPAGGPWTALWPSPEATTIWLQAEDAVARRSSDGDWTVFPLDVTDGAKARFFAPLSAATAVQVRARACSAAERASAKAESNLRPYFEAHPEKFQVDGKPHPFSDFVASTAAGRWWPFAVDNGCVDISVLGAASPMVRTVIPPASPERFVAWRGGFAGLGSPTVVFRDGAWLPPTSPLARALGGLADDAAVAFGARDHVYIRRRAGLEVLDVATAASQATISMEMNATVGAVEESSTGAAILSMSTPDVLDGLFAVGARGELTALGAPRAPMWTGGLAPTRAPGQTARAFTTGSALVVRDGARWTVLFSAAARRHGLATLRRPND